MIWDLGAWVPVRQVIFTVVLWGLSGAQLSHLCGEDWRALSRSHALWPLVCVEITEYLLLCAHMQGNKIP